SAECASHTAHDDDPQIAMRVEPARRRGQFLKHRRADRVQSVRAIEGEPPEGAFDLDFDRLKFLSIHRLPLHEWFSLDMRRQDQVHPATRNLTPLSAVSLSDDVVPSPLYACPRVFGPEVPGDERANNSTGNRGRRGVPRVDHSGGHALPP